MISIPTSVTFIACRMMRPSFTIDVHPKANLCIATWIEPETERAICRWVPGRDREDRMRLIEECYAIIVEKIRNSESVRST